MDKTINVYMALMNVRKELIETTLIKSGKGAFNNSYTPLPDIIKVAEPLLLKNGVLSIFDECTSHVNSEKPNEALFLLTLYHPESDTKVVNHIKVELEKRTPQGKRSAYTYAQRSLYESTLVINKEDDDATNTMTVAELDEAIKSLTRQKNKLSSSNNNVQNGDNPFGRK